MSGAERNLYNALKPGTVEFHRGVAMSWCSYSFVAQCRSWLPDAVGGVCWFAFENPGQSPRIPIYAGSNKLPDAFYHCGHHGVDDNAALWQYRKANKLAQVRWGSVKNLMMTSVMDFEKEMIQQDVELQSFIKNEGDKCKGKKLSAKLNGITDDFYKRTSKEWKDLENKFWSLFWSGF